MQAANTNSISENTIRARFSSRTWAVNLNINAEPVNHNLPEPPQYCAVEYWPQRGEVRDHALERFVEAVERAAKISLQEPAVLDVGRIEQCDDDVIDWLTVLLQTGREMEWCDGTRVELNPDNLIVNLWLDENDPATAGVVDRITAVKTKLSETQNEKYPGLSPRDVERMTPEAREAIARGRMPARMVAAVYGLRSAEAAERLFPAAVVESIPTRLGAWPEFYYDIERYVGSWTRLDDVPAGLFEELTDAGRRWFRARIQKMIRRRIVEHDEPSDRHDTTLSLFLRLAGATGDEQFSELAAAVLMLVHEVETGQIRYDDAIKLAREHARRIVG